MNNTSKAAFAAAGPFNGDTGKVTSTAEHTSRGLRQEQLKGDLPNEMLLV